MEEASTVASPQSLILQRQVERAASISGQEAHGGNGIRTPSTSPLDGGDPRLNDGSMDMFSPLQSTPPKDFAAGHSLKPRQRTSGHSHLPSPLQQKRPDFHKVVEPSMEVPKRHTLTINGAHHTTISSLFLRDLCTCPRCVDSSTKQKLFSTVDIPEDIRARQAGMTFTTADGTEQVKIKWENDVPGCGPEHVSIFDEQYLHSFESLETVGPSQTRELHRTFWTSEQFTRDVPELEYEAYMSDDASLLQALDHLHTHGLLFLTNVPASETSVSTIAERIGPLKNTFYGSTWDVRSVPQAKNVAYTSQDLGFHMDLLYMQQPPHLQFLHCIRSSSAGGASLFTDSFRAASKLFAQDPEAFTVLSSVKVGFHYNHPTSHYYHQSRPVLEVSSQLAGGLKKHNLAALAEFAEVDPKTAYPTSPHNIENWIRSVAWSPPFQGPFPIPKALPNAEGSNYSAPPMQRLAVAVEKWHAAARKFNALIHEEEAMHERIMKPGECVIFDNRRVLHARRAFEVGDMGKERWLRGAYLDQDPYLSKLKVLRNKLADTEAQSGEGGTMEQIFHH